MNSFTFFVKADIVYSLFGSDNLPQEVSLKCVYLFLFLFFVSAQSSELYKNIVATRALKILRRTESEIFLEHSAFLFLLKAAHASCFLLFTSSGVPSKLPRYLQVFQLSSVVVLLMLYSSVLSGLTIRLLLVRIAGMVFFISSLASLLVVIHETSSAYCCSIRYDFWFFGVIDFL